MASPIAPWHTWGNSVTQRVTLAAPGSVPIVSSQLVRISYKRPETWRFCLWGRLMGGDTPVGAILSVNVLFDVYLGVGRSVLRTERTDNIIVLADCFLRLHWLVPVGTPPGQQAGNVKYATQVMGPVLDDSGTTQLPIELLTAEDIQCRARAFVNSGDAVGVGATVEFGCFFAPNTHVRPDWMARHNQFLGGEIGGT